MICEFLGVPFPDREKFGARQEVIVIGLMTPSAGFDITANPIASMESFSDGYLPVPLRSGDLRRGFRTRRRSKRRRCRSADSIGDFAFKRVHDYLKE
ncbi:hypothetical protein [Actinoplanes sp. NPDC049265]|uniref:hypothetical protein n=1 Tax=Actinoplanes sp. NPDC049265 TaxID=3363902 RepID=UPI00370FAE41